MSSTICWGRMHCDHTAWKPHQQSLHLMPPVPHLSRLCVPSPLPPLLRLTANYSPTPVSFLPPAPQVHFIQLSRTLAQTTQGLNSSVRFSFLGTTHHLPELTPNFSGHFRPWLLGNDMLSLFASFPWITDMTSTHPQNPCFSRNILYFSVFMHLLFCAHLKCTPQTAICPNVTFCKAHLKCSYCFNEIGTSFLSLSWASTQLAPLFSRSHI